MTKTFVLLLPTVILMTSEAICDPEPDLNRDLPIVGSFPPDPTADIPWGVGMGGVGDIQAAFDAARVAENAQLGTSIPPLASLPSQAVWDGMSHEQKALWLINHERIDRGVLPHTDVEANVTQVAQDYAQFLFDNDAFSHTADGGSPPMRLDANPAIGACKDFLEVSENLAVFVTSGNNIPLPVERSVYAWIYDDSGSAWGHRRAVLWFPYNDNSGPTGSEGFVGIGVVSGGPYQGPFSQSWPLATMVVMNMFDPCATWVTTTTTYLYFPRVINTPDERTGVAIANVSEPDSAEGMVRQQMEANMTFRAYDLGGQLITGPDITNPAMRQLGPSSQLAELFSQIFGPGFVTDSAWVEVESDNDQIVGFFLFFDDALNFLDGSDAGGQTHTEMIFTETDLAELNLANPNTSNADVVLELYDAETGNLLSRRDDVQIPGMGKMRSELSALFPEAEPLWTIQQAGDPVRQASTRSLRVNSSVGIVGFSRLGDGIRFIGGLNGQPTGGATKLFVPQYVEGGGFDTELSIANLDAMATANVSLDLVGEDGRQIGMTAIVVIPARGKAIIRDPTVFGLPANATIEGYIVVTSDGPKLAGSVIFGDPAGEIFQAALPFVSQVQREVFYSQVAQNDLFFTGAAIINLSDSALTATIDVFDTQGNLVGTGMRMVVARGRDSFVLTEMFPGLDISAGYFRVRTDQDMASFAIFGTHTLSAISAVPPQTAS